jgi:hypothetical protein
VVTSRSSKKRGEKKGKKRGKTSPTSLSLYNLENCHNDFKK